MQIRRNVSLKNYSNYKIGGAASFFLEISSKDELIEGLKKWREISKNFSNEQKDIFILGGGANVLIDDEGFLGLVIFNNIKSIVFEDNLVIAGSGLLIKELLDFCMENSLTGFEWAGGLPGTIGGAVRGNAGAFGKETKDLIYEVKSINLESLGEKTRDKKECDFSYRNSIYKKEKKNEFIFSVALKLSQGNQEEIKKVVEEKRKYRKDNHPMDVPSLGSTFKNIPFEKLSLDNKEKFKESIKNDPFPVLPVAKLLYLANLKGKRIGNAQVSEKHPNFIINLGNAKSEEVKKLIDFIKKTIKDKFNIELEEEIVYLSN